MFPVLIVALVIVIGAAVIVLTTDSPGGSAPAATASGPAEGGAGKTVKIDIADFKFDPPAITVKKGTKIEWTNSDSAPHTATADDGSFDTDNLDQDQSKVETFAKTGTISYHCDFHAFMTASIEVK